MAAPSISWRTDTNSGQVTSLDFGTVDAGSISPIKTILLWNNFNGQTAVADATNGSITTKDASGGNTTELVLNKWIEVKNLSNTGDTTFDGVGGTVSKTVKAETAPSGVISGAVNDGNVNTTATKANFAKLSFRANIPTTAIAGQNNFLIRYQYQYVE